MRILIDASSINRKNVLASIPNYILRLVDGFLVYSSCDITLLVDSDFKEFFEEKYPAVTKCYIKRNYFLYRIPFIGELYGRWKYRNATAKLNCDVMLVASDLDHSSRIKIHFKRIQVIHDLKGVKDGTFFQIRKCKRFYRDVLSNSDVIVAISDYTKNDIIKFFKIDAIKIDVIPNSVLISEQEVTPSQAVPDKYILYVNTLGPQKNPQILIKAFELACSVTDYKLVLVGKKTSYWKNVLLPYIKTHNLISKIVHYQNLSKEELQFIYNRASLFVTPSMREGFGYTPIEAAISKIPVLCSTCEALPCSTQGLLNYYEPVDDYKSLAKKMIELLTKLPSKKKLNYIANKFKKDYSIQKQVQRFMDLAQKLDNDK